MGVNTFASRLADYKEDQKKIGKGIKLEHPHVFTHNISIDLPIYYGDFTPNNCL